MRIKLAYAVPLLGILISSFAALSQEKAGKGDIPPLGTLRSQVLRTMGDPDHFFVPALDRFVEKLESKSFAERYGVADVYIRKTVTNEYQLILFYSGGSGQLHPDPQLSSIRIRIDKPIAATQLVTDVRELQSACSEGCNLLGLPGVSAMFVDAVISPAFVKPCNSEDSCGPARSEIDDFSARLRKSPGYDHLYACALGSSERMKPGVILEWPHLDGFTPDPSPDSWLKHPVYFATIKALPSDLCLGSQRREKKNPKVHLGSWKP